MLLAGKKFYCPVCRKRIYRFRRLSDAYSEQWTKYHYKHNIFNSETFNFIAYSCPSCEASDRDRLCAIFLADYFKRSPEIKILEIAPSEPLSKFIRSFSNVKYRTADLYRKNVDDVIDVANMSAYPDESFDFILCSHVLEHIADDIKALRELYRVLSMNGKGIIMSPIQLDLEKDYELHRPLSNEERWHHYGQKDHLRTYSKNGFMEKIRSVGFDIEEITVKNYSKQLFVECGIQEGSVLYVVSKKIN